MAELDLAELADRLAIRRLVEDYARAADRVDGAAAGACIGPGRRTHGACPSAPGTRAGATG